MRLNLSLIVDLDERREAIRSALRLTGGNVTAAAALLSAHRVTLWYHLRRCGIGHEAKAMRAARKRRFRLPPVAA